MKELAGEWIGSGRYANPVAAGMISYAVDERAAASEALVHSYFESTLLGVAITSPDKGWLKVNRRLCEMLGYSEAELATMTWVDLTHPEDVQKCLDFFDRVATGRLDRYSIEKRFVHASGNPMFVSIDVSCHRRPDNSVEYYTASIQDISERRRTEAVLTAAKADADAANMAKSAFLANMSHEIRTPMNAVLGLTHLLQRSDPTPEQADRLAKIDSAANHLLAVINDVLDIAKIEAGKFVLDETEFRLSSVLDDVHSLISGQAQAKGLSINVDLVNAPRWLSGDPTRLRQALFNFTANAVKFTERGSIALRAILLQASADDVVMRFEVQDTGIGIEPLKLGSLFRAFEQAYGSTSHGYGGTGLGLSITKHLAELMGGEAGAESEPGRGSTFWFTARLKRASGHAATGAVDAGASDEDALRLLHSGKRILVADDDPLNLEVASIVLGATGLVIECATDGDEAVAKAGAEEFDLILMDMQMPRLDGIAATREIRRSSKGNMPIIAMTANAFEDDKRRCLDAGMNDFVSKPYDPELLFALLLRWLARTPGR